MSGSIRAAAACSDLPKRKSKICWWESPNVAARASCPCTSACRCRPRRRTYPISLARPDPPSTAIRDLSDIQSTLPRLLRSNDALWEPRSGMLRTGSGASACPSMLCRKWDRCFGTTASNRSGFARRRRPAWPPVQNAFGDSRIESRIRFRCCLSSHRGGTQAAERAPKLAPSATAAEPRYFTVMFCGSGRRTRLADEPRRFMSTRPNLG